MLLSLVLANNTILSCLVFFFVIIDLYSLISPVITQIFDPIVELVVPTGVSNKEAKSKWNHIQYLYRIKLESIQYKVPQISYASFSSIYFSLFLQ